MIGVGAKRDGARLIFPDRLQDLAEGRVDGAKDQEKAEQEPGQNDVIKHGGVGEIENSEQVPLRNTLDAVFAMGERRLQIDEIQKLRQRERNHREIDALAAYRNHPGEDTKPGRSGGADQNSKLGR